MGPGPLIVLAGPTAAGKSDLALALGSALPLEIVSADSMQVYRGMDIGTAKPGRAERDAVPHHLIDIADPDEDFDAGRFVAAAERAIEGIRARGRFPLVVGGTGMYIRALLRGLDDLPADPAVRAELALRWEAEGGQALHALLESVDAASARAIHPRDRVRLLRALEIHRITGVPASARRRSWAGRGASGRDLLFLALRVERGELSRRIDRRVDRMIEAGFVEEVRRLLAAGYGARLKSMSSLGYRHIASHLEGGVPLPSATERMKSDTRGYAKRQMTWLSREGAATWLEGDSASAQAVDLATKHLY